METSELNSDCLQNAISPRIHWVYLSRRCLTTAPTLPPPTHVHQIWMFAEHSILRLVQHPSIVLSSIFHPSEVLSWRAMMTPAQTSLAGPLNPYRNGGSSITFISQPSLAIPTQMIPRDLEPIWAGFHSLIWIKNIPDFRHLDHRDEAPLEVRVWFQPQT